jgi:hypothetical protein
MSVGRRRGWEKRGGGGEGKGGGCSVNVFPTPPLPPKHIHTQLVRTWKMSKCKSVTGYIFIS